MRFQVSRDFHVATLGGNAEVLNGSFADRTSLFAERRERILADLKPHLPYLLWLYQMGLILFWLYDRSPNQQRTEKLMEKSLGLLVNLLRLSGLPLMKPLRKTALELVETVSL